MSDRLLTARELNACTGAIVDAATEIHKAVGPGLLEKATTYLRLADLRVGLLLNFGERTMKAGTHRIVNRFPDA